ncbi:cysteine proteinase [Backusella circina FSU 941]|nr:cysteine proteinase [Backusella circina FSU 941]
MSSPKEQQQPTDEEILQHEQRIKDEEAQKVPLVSLPEPIAKLEKEFEGNEPFIKKIKNLGQKHKEIRRCRGDGNCFFRAFAFAWFEKSLKDSTKYALYLETLKGTPELLEKSGFQKLAFEDFYDVTLEQFVAISPSDPDMLLVNFQSDEISNCIVMHLRFVASAYLRMHSPEYEPFIIDEMISIDEFCVSQVEAFGRESDHLQIIALSKALEIPVKVVYLDGGAGEEAAVHEFWPDESNQVEEDALKLIYRPGHYDILY